MSSLRRYALALAASAPILGIAACSNPPAADAGNQVSSTGDPAAAFTPNQELPASVPVENGVAPGEAAKVEADYIGKWVGPEGLVLEVKAKPGGGVTIVNQWSLDDKGSFEGSVTAEGLRFMRKGEAVTATPSDGDATGMKWLAGKKDCLTVTVGSEGYCRG